MKDEGESFLRSLNPPPEIITMAEVSTSKIDANEIVRIILGDSLLDECNLYKWHGDCGGCPFYNDKENDHEWGICNLRRMVRLGNKTEVKK
jgi:hypothetical protein